MTHLLGNSSCPSKAPEGCLSSHTALPTNRMVSATSGEMKSGSAAGSTTCRGERQAAVAQQRGGSRAAAQYTA